ncbi:MAG: transcriptional regulator [Herbinix sp.]|jgi:transcriptional regulator with XRE-family HTH domain|nr:transcriptional regulator [Herbinix sp.]
MSLDMNKVGEQIALLRKIKGLTQAELADRVGISFQAVSKWERGETLPDVSTLVILAEVFETSIDFILNGGTKIAKFKGRKKVSDIKKGIDCLIEMGNLLGQENLLYRSAIAGIDSGMNMDIETYLSDSKTKEAVLAEAIVQCILSNYYVDITDIRKNFSSEHFADIVCDYASKNGIQ